MSDGLPLKITNAGRAALAAAIATATAVTIAQVGLTAAAFFPAPTIVALPAEFGRLAAVSGVAIGDDVVHMTAQDSTDAEYTVRGFGLYLSDGTLFAVYGQDDPIFEKAEVSTLLIAVDVKFAAGEAAHIEFGDTSFIYPPATETMRGVAEIATQAETDAGADDERIVTPKKLAQRLVAVVGGVIGDLWGRHVNTAGLATGGGDLSVDRTITVPRASGAEAISGLLDDRAVTPAALRAVLLDREIVGGGLAMGGGDLLADRIITVNRASAADAIAGVNEDVALTPRALWSFPGADGATDYFQIPGTSWWIMFVDGAISANTTIVVTLPTTFPHYCRLAVVNAGRTDYASQDNDAFASSWNASSVTVFNPSDAAQNFWIMAVGR